MWIKLVGDSIIEFNNVSEKPSDEYVFIADSKLIPSEQKEGYITVQKYDPTNQTIYNEFIEVPQPTTPPLTENQKKIAELEIQNTNLMLAIAEMAEANELEKTETQLAIAELAEIITGGV